ncbi:MAG: stage V sporulation protein AC [Oscillospiraceae bacterium]|nr:stage V sporulation protein AC [Oscillospiraceae bacterium]
MQELGNEEYARLVKKLAPASPVAKDCAKAFVSGGVICAAGQALLEFWKAVGLAEKDAAAAVSVTLIFVGALLTGLGVFDKIAKHAGAGTLVPITGFANSVAASALEFKTEGFVAGTAVKMFTIAGPVIVFGVAASVVYGIVLVIVGAV